MKGKSIHYISVILIFLLTFPISNLYSEEGNKHGEIHDENTVHDEEEGFNAGAMIIEHVKDSYEWHIFSIGETHVSIYLPVILYNTETGNLEVFCSKHFHHGHSAYKGYHIVQKGGNKGKIVYTDNSGHESFPLDFSITKTVLAFMISSVLLMIIFISIANRYKKRKKQAPKGLQSLLEPLILFIRDDVAIPAIGKDKYLKYMPYLLTIFFFIFFNNILGIIPIFPGGANVTGNITVTGTIALFTFIITTTVGNKNYWQHIFNAPGVPWWLKFPIPLMPVVELMGVFTKPFVLMIRLFANILAGHLIILGFVSLIFVFGAINMWLGYGVSIVSIIFGLFMSLLELLVAFIQAYVFTMLSSLYFGMATEEEHH